MDKQNTNAPIVGQMAAFVIGPRGAYLARFPYEAAGSRDLAWEAARRWRERQGPPGSIIRGFTGRVRLVWEDNG